MIRGQINHSHCNHCGIKLPAGEISCKGWKTFGMVDAMTGKLIYQDIECDTCDWTGKIMVLGGGCLKYE